MKIVYCTDSIRHLGGIQRVTAIKAAALAAVEGNEVWVVVTDNKTGMLTQPLPPEVHLVDLDVNYYADDFKSKLHVLKGILLKRRIHRRRLEALMREIGPDVIIATGTSEKYFVPDVARKVGAACVREIHFSSGYRRLFAIKTGSLFDKISARVADFIDFRLGVRRYDRLVVLTEEDRADNWSDYAPAVAIPNPITVTPLAPSPQTAREIVATGRLDGQKGYDMLVTACRKVFDRHPDWHLTIYGEGPQRGRLEQMISEAGLEENISLPGAVTDIPARLAASSIIVLSSRYEGLALTLLEGMAAGLAPVAFACKCGPRDIITDGVDGLLVAEGDTDALAAAINRLIDDPALRREMGRAALRRSAHFALPVITERWMNLFNSLTRR